MRSNRSKNVIGLFIVLAVLATALMTAPYWLGLAPEYRWLVPAGLIVFAALFAVLLYAFFIAQVEWRRENPAPSGDTSLAKSPVRRTVIGLTAVTGAMLAVDLALEIYGLPHLPIAIGYAIGTSFLVLLLAWLALSATKPNEIHGIDLLLRIVATIAVTVFILLVASLALKGYYGEPAPHLALVLTLIFMLIPMLLIWYTVDARSISPLRVLALGLVSLFLGEAAGDFVLGHFGFWDLHPGQIVAATISGWLLYRWREPN